MTDRAPSTPLQPVAAPVFDVLSRGRARLIRHATIGDGFRMAEWSNADDESTYERPGHHNLSVYLAGGHGVQLRGSRHDTGGPGLGCVLPADHSSHWFIGGSLRFVHLYVSPKDWSERVIRLLDVEPRSRAPEQRIFVQDLALSRWADAVTGLDWDDPVERLHAQIASHGAIDALVMKASGRASLAQGAMKLRGGLAPAVRRRVLDCIETRLTDPAALTLGALAGLACLSEFHFARMFRVSMDHSVHEWILRRRIDRAKLLLAAHGTKSLAQISAECGLGNASHLARHFRRQTGATPMQWRSASHRRAVRPEAAP